MKPEDLKSPFSWEQRRVLLQEQVLFVPDYYEHYDQFVFPGWEHPSIFGNSHPVHVEYCSGNGAWIASKAVEFPNINWVAIELKFERVRKIWSKKQNLSLNNLFIICGEGNSVTERYFPDHTLSEIYINFPDPWPKNKHAKHRIIKPTFLDLMHRKLICDGNIAFVTDDESYSNETIQIFREHQKFTLKHPEGYVNEWLGYGNSYFESLWRSKGKKIRYHQFQKQ